MKHAVHIGRRHPGIHQIAETGDPHVQNIRKERADHSESQPENQRHDSHETWDRRILSGKHAVDLRAAHVFFAFSWFYHSLLADSLYKIKAHMRDSCRTVQSPLRLHLFYDMLKHFLFVPIQVQFLQDQPVSFRQLGRGEPYRDPGLFRVILDEMHDGVETSVYRSAVFLRVAEVNDLRLLLIFRHMKGVGHQLVDTFVFRGGDGNHRDPQHFLHLVDTDGSAVFPHLVHHVQGQDHGNIQLHQLHGKVQVTLDIRSVHNIYDSSGMFVQDEVPCHDLLTGIRRHGINAWKVSHQCVFLSPDRTVFPVHRHAGKIPHVLAGTGELIEKSRLSAVLIPRQGESQRLVLRQRVLGLFEVVFTALAQAGMWNGLFAFPLFFIFFGRVLIRVPDILDFYFFRIGKPQRQFITVDPQFHGISHRRVLYHGHLAFGNQSHIEEMLP